MKSKIPARLFLATYGLSLSMAQTPPVKMLRQADCSAEKLGTGIPIASIGLPVAEVRLNPPQWRDGANGVPAHCSIEGVMAPVDKSATARPIRFGVALPASWSFRAAQIGGGGMNGVIPRIGGPLPRGGPALLFQGFATYGSDSGHQSGGGPPGGMPGRGPQATAGRGEAAMAMPPPDPSANDWALNEEAIANLGYMQLKKTHDAAMVLIQRAYGARPRFNYFFGTSQGGREALTVAQRYPADYDGVSAEVPILSFSSLMLAPELIRIQEKPLTNWVTPRK